MDYSNFEIEDLANDDSFVQWVIDKNPVAGKFWEAFKCEHPQMCDKIEQARTLLLSLHMAQASPADSAKLARNWLSIQDKISAKASRSHFSFVRIAASLTVLVALSAIYMLLLRGSVSEENPRHAVTLSPANDLMEKVNATGGVLRISLSDGTIVCLGDKSRLRYSKDYKNKPNRKVYLTGEAFFDVAKDPQRPFYVYANEVVTKVLGTSFRVRAFGHDKNVMVSVKEGKVSVYSKKAHAENLNTKESEVNGVVLMPNQQVLYKGTDDSFNKSLIDSPAVLKESIVTYNFNFRNAPVKNVFDVLGEAYGVEIIFNEEVLVNCYLTAPLGDEPLFEKLKIICRTIGASYELIDASIVISSRGCGDDATQNNH
jgi:transmembrane sensor